MRTFRSVPIVFILFASWVLAAPTAEETSVLSAVEMARQAGDPGRALLCLNLTNAGMYYLRNQRLAEATDYLNRALAEARLTSATHPAQVPSVTIRLALVDAESGRVDQARRLNTEALATLRALPKTPPDELAFAENIAGTIDLLAGRFDSAEAHLHEAVRLAGADLDTPENAEYNANLGLTFVLEGRFDRAMPVLRRAEYVLDKSANQNPKLRAPLLVGLGVAAAGQGKYGLAEKYGRSAIAAYQAAPVPDRVAIALAEVHLASVYLRENRLSDAEALLTHAVPDTRRLSQNPITLGTAVEKMAELRFRQHDWHASRQLYKEALELWTGAFSEGHPHLPGLYRDYADALKRDGGTRAEVKDAARLARTVSSFR